MLRRVAALCLVASTALVGSEPLASQPTDGSGSHDADHDDGSEGDPVAGSQDEVYTIVRSVGPPSGTSVAEWVAKAGQESSFRRDVVNARGCVGYWQICPTNFGWLGVSEGSLRNNARLQFQSVKRIYARQGWAAWNASGGKPDAGDIAEHAGRSTSLTSPGDLLAGAAGLADSIPDPLDPLNAIGSLVEPLAALAGAVKGFGEWLTDPDTWRRIALVVAGGGIVLVGAATIARGTELGKTVENVATTVVPAGRAVKAAKTAGAARSASIVSKAQRSMKAGAAKTRPKG